jgi:hypothetical protein
MKNHAMETNGRGEEQLHYSWPWHYTELNGQLHAPAALSVRAPQYPLYKRLEGPQSLYGRCGVEQNLIALPGIESLPSSL